MKTRIVLAGSFVIFLVSLSSFQITSTAAVNGEAGIVNFSDSSVSGYEIAAFKHAVFYVQGSWIVPKLNCTTGDGTVEQWVGMDSRELAGTIESCAGNGILIMSAFYELPTTTMVFVNLNLKAGDMINAYVFFHKKSFSVYIADKNQSTSKFVSCSFCSGFRSIAQWVIERPYDCNSFVCTLSPLPNFGTQKFGANYTGGYSDSAELFSPFAPVATIGSYSTNSLVTIYEITMLSDANASRVLASASSLVNNESFSVQWQAYD